MQSIFKTAEKGRRFDRDQHRRPGYGLALSHEPLRLRPILHSWTTLLRALELGCTKAMTVAAVFTQGWASRTNRRRHAAALIATWAVFWLVLAVQPCHDALAQTPGHAQSQIIAEASHHAGHTHADGPGMQGGIDCAEVSASDFGAVASVAAKVDRLVPFPASRIPPITATRTPGSQQCAYYGTSLPPVALYLRNLHLLI